MNLHQIPTEPATWELHVIRDGEYCDLGWDKKFCARRNRPDLPPSARAHHYCIEVRFNLYPYYCECLTCNNPNNHFAHYFNRNAARRTDPGVRACQPCLEGRHPA